MLIFDIFEPWALYYKDNDNCYVRRWSEFRNEPSSAALPSVFKKQRPWWDCADVQTHPSL